MKVEIIAVGTEMLLGQIVNTNASTIAGRLADHGLAHHFQTVVGDNPERMADVIGAAARRSDAVIITGGIGPTQDDVTREVVAQVAGVPLEFDDAYATALRARWDAMGREFPESNLRQAYRPEGSAIVENPKGSAPGFRAEIDGCRVFALPGVPQEMVSMLDDDVLPFLAAEQDDAGVVVSRFVRSWGISEAKVGELLDDLFATSENPTVAFLASSGVIKIRLTSRAESEAAARALIAPVETEVRHRLGHAVFGVDDDTIEHVLHAALLERGWTIATAESATAGLVASRLTSVPGASSIFRGSIGAYAVDVKVDVLGVDPAVIEAHGVVSEETALAMARAARDLLKSEVAVSVTGSAGPDPLEVEAGTMCVAVVTPETERVRTFRMPGDRERVRTYTATAALHQIRLAIEES